MNTLDSYSFPEIVAACTHVNRIIWGLIYPLDDRDSRVEWIKGSGLTKNWRLRFDWNEIHDACLDVSFQSEVTRKVLSSIGRVHPEETYSLPLQTISHPFTFARSMLKGHERPDGDIKYFSLQQTRMHYKCTRNSTTIRRLRVLSEVTESQICGALARQSNRGNPSVHYKTLIHSLREGLIRSEQDSHAGVDASIEQFIFMCRTVGYLLPGYGDNKVRFSTESIDSEYLVSHLFGLPTEIEGLDELFGGGGICFAEDIDDQQPQSGRAVLIKGRFGTGKTILGLQLASEIARKGGAALFSALEQPVSDCQYTLESMGTISNSKPFRVTYAATEAAQFLNRPPRAVAPGVLVLQSSVKESFKGFLAALISDSKTLKRYPLRLICVDPVNAVYRDGSIEKSTIRAEFLQAIKQIKAAGTNLLLLSEENRDQKVESWFEENVVDTVISLSERQHHDYSRRFFEIKKSRLQREQRGEHPYSIQSGSGIHIHPSSAAVSARIRNRRTSHSQIPTKFGLPSLDRILGEKGIQRGNIVLLKGPSGTYKTQVGMIFLTPRREETDDSIALLIAAGDAESAIEDKMNTTWFSNHLKMKNGNAARSVKNIWVKSIPLGHIHPGQLLQTIEHQFEKAKRSGKVIDRVVIDNISHWDLSCPFIAEDEVFSDTLINLIRSRGATGLLLCSDTHQASVIQKPMIDAADCVIEFDRFEFRGERRVSVRVIKTPGMQHLSESYELKFENDLFSIKEAYSMIRVRNDGETHPIPVKMFLHAESDEQFKYNRSWCSAIATVLSGDTALESQHELFTGGAMSLGRAMTIDELHVVQLDEYQIPAVGERRKKDRQHHLYEFSPDLWDNDRWGKILKVYNDRCKCSSDGHFMAVPFYGDVGLLAYRKDKIDSAAIGSWVKLADSCREWEAKNEEAENDSVFFDFPHVTGENYNALFFEILASIHEPPSGKSFLSWIGSDRTLDACEIFWTLMRRAFRSDLHRRQHAATRNRTDLVDVNADDYRSTTELNDSHEPYRVSRNCVVWRHWFSTLNQMLSEMNVEDVGSIAIASVPGELPVSGEWYLAVPAYSAAPEVGLEIIKNVTGIGGELDLLGHGVGLPLTESFYGTEESVAVTGSAYLGTTISISADMVKSQMTQAIRRSDFAGYGKWNFSLSQHLQRMLRITELDIVERRKLFNDVAQEVSHSVKVITG